MGLTGFASILATSAATAPLAAVAGILGGAAVHTYLTLMIPRRAVRKLAMNYVEHMMVLPPGTGPVQPAVEGEGHRGEASLWAEPSQANLPATVEGATAWLSTIGSLELQLRQGNVTRWLRLEEPAAAWEGARFTGLVEDGRVTFGDACQRLGLLQFEGPETSACSNAALLEALQQTGKFIAAEEVNRRTDVPFLFQLPASGPSPEGIAMAKAGQPEMPVAGPHGATQAHSPAAQIARAGNQSLLRGGFMLILGFALSVRALRRQEPSEASKVAPVNLIPPSNQRS